MLDASAPLNTAAAAIVDDSFTKCFQESPPDAWAWNWYLFPMHYAGVAVRYCVLFPIRVAILVGAWLLFFATFFPVHALLTPWNAQLGARIERKLCMSLCAAFVASWTGVIKYHGPRPVQKANQVYVANHTSMIDFIVLEQWAPFAVIMQKHKGWVGFCQDHILNALGCVWFNRAESKDKLVLKRKMRAHVTNPDSNPLLIFPEGTCVNNRYTVQFKKGAFDLGEDVLVYPVAIHYNKTFVDAFWNSKRQSFTQHLLTLMTSWAVVADVTVLEPQRRLENEPPEDFAARVQMLIAERANLRVRSNRRSLGAAPRGSSCHVAAVRRELVYGRRVPDRLPAGAGLLRPERLVLQAEGLLLGRRADEGREEADGCGRKGEPIANQSPS